MTQLLLIRHAHTDWVNERLAGWTEGVPLSEQGHAEARRLAERLADYPLTAVFSSPLERSRQTAAYLTGPRGLELRLLEGLGEVRFGAWTGRSLKELKEDPLWPVVQQRPSQVRFPGGESFPEMQARALTALEEVLQAVPQGAVAVVSHGDVIKALLAYLSGLHLDHFQRLAVATASVSVVHFGASGPRVLLMNDTGQVPRPPDPAKDGEEPATLAAAAAA